MRAGHPTRVALVVEDDPLVRIDVVEKLRDRGWEVLETDTGEEAIDLMDRHHLDIVLTDIQLAGRLTGWDVARAARNRWPAVPVVYMSARAVEDAQRVLDSVFYPKPYDPLHVVLKAEELLAKS